MFKPASPPAADNPVIQLDGISVHYRAAQERIPSIKEYTIRWLKGEIRYESLIALRDINLKIFPGEVLVIIGPNGREKVPC
jgi:ABC-type polysaccharide/polyol phosphate transport system ATPase subunit